MRAVRLLSVIVLVGLASALVLVGSAAAQGSGMDPTGGNSPTGFQADVDFDLPRIFRPPVHLSSADFRLAMRFAFARCLPPSWLPSRARVIANPADLPARRRGSL